MHACRVPRAQRQGSAVCRNAASGRSATRAGASPAPPTSVAALAAATHALRVNVSDPGAGRRRRWIDRSKMRTVRPRRPVLEAGAGAR